MRTKLRFGYKVVEVDEDGTLISPVVSTQHAIATYGKGLDTFPPDGCGPLCVFSNKRTAARFLRRIDDQLCDCCTLELWRCAYVPTEERCVWDGGGLYFRVHLDELAEGTRLAQTVSLLEKIPV